MPDSSKKRPWFLFFFLFLGIFSGIGSRVYYAFFFQPARIDSLPDAIQQMSAYENWWAFFSSSVGIVFHALILIGFGIALLIWLIPQELPQK